MSSIQILSTHFYWFNLKKTLNPFHPVIKTSPEESRKDTDEKWEPGQNVTERKLKPQHTHPPFADFCGFLRIFTTTFFSTQLLEPGIEAN